MRERPDYRLRFCNAINLFDTTAVFLVVKGQITACGFVTIERAVRILYFYMVKGQITACGFVTLAYPF